MKIAVVKKQVPPIVYTVAPGYANERLVDIFSKKKVGENQ